MNIRIKALEWEKGVVDLAKPLSGMKYVACSTTPAGSWAFWLEDAPETRGVFLSETEAKAAAQADYERRILSALSSHPRDTNTVASHETGKVRDKIASPEGQQEAARIGDAVLDWMIKYDLLDGCREYYVDDVVSVLNDFAPSSAPEGQQPVAQHVAYFDDGQFHWMSGVAPRNCELYSRPSEQAVTEEMVQIFIDVSRDECAGYRCWSEAVRAALKAAMEAGG